MLAHLLHQADDEALEIRVQRLDRVHRSAQHREPLGDVLGIERDAGERPRASGVRRS